MAAAMLQWEKEDASRHRKGDTAKTTAVKPTHQQPAVCQVAKTPSITPQPEPPPPLLFPRHPPPILTPCSPDMWNRRFLGTDANTSTITTDSNAAKENSAPPHQEENKEIESKDYIHQLKLL